MSLKNNESFLKFLQNKSERDIAIMLKSLEKNLSELTPQIEYDVAKISDISLQLEETKNNVVKLNEELSTIQTNAGKNKETQKFLIIQIEQIRNYLETISKVSEKTAYVNRCIDYIVQTGYIYVDRISKYCVKVNKCQFTQTYLRNNVEDNEIIKITHMIHVFELYDEFYHDYKNFEFYYDNYDINTKEILFSEKMGCDDRPLNDEKCPCCHKVYAYSIGYMHDIIKYNNFFSIDSKLNDVCSLIRLN
jgi:hypothetical protein